MRIVIFGASGKLGRLTTRHLRQRLPDARLVLTSRRPTETSSEWLTFDPFKDDWAVLGKVDVLVNCIGVIQETEMDYTTVHEGLVERILDNYAAIGQPRIVQMSALGARPDHPVDFLGTKGRADAHLLAELPESVVVRPSIVCTPNTMVAQKLRKLLRAGRMTLGKVFVPAGFPRTRVQPVMPEDLGQVMAEAVASPGRHGIIDVVGPEELEFGTILDWMEEGMGREMKLVELPKSFLEPFVKHFLSVWFPSTINYDQFRLLFMDNIGSSEAMESWLGRVPKGSREFWIGEGKREKGEVTPELGALNEV